MIVRASVEWSVAAAVVVRAAAGAAEVSGALSFAGFAQPATMQENAMISATRLRVLCMRAPCEMVDAACGRVVRSVDALWLRFAVLSSNAARNLLLDSRELAERSRPREVLFFTT